MTDELKPCPFCGAELKARTAVQYPKMALARIHPGSVEDGTCPIAGWGFYDEQIETWNTRAEDTALQQRVRELEEAIEAAAEELENRARESLNGHVLYGGALAIRALTKENSDGNV